MEAAHRQPVTVGSAPIATQRNDGSAAVASELVWVQAADRMLAYVPQLAFHPLAQEEAAGAFAEKKERSGQQAIRDDFSLCVGGFVTEGVRRLSQNRHAPDRTIKVPTLADTLASRTCLLPGNLPLSASPRSR